jgi:hypothetical protein
MRSCAARVGRRTQFSRTRPRWGFKASPAKKEQQLPPAISRTSIVQGFSAPRVVRRDSTLIRALAAIIGIAFLLFALFYFSTSLFAIANFAWRQPMFDQWRMYIPLLTQPFPENVVELENGHRPIIPNLMRLAEVRWFAANQMLQLGIGMACAVTSLSILLIILWRDRALNFSTHAAGSLICVLGILWLANARMLMHGNEALHAHLVILAVICAALCVYRSSLSVSSGWIIAASLCCATATFCFGPGVASFPAVIALGILFHIPLRRLAIPAALLIICLFIYLYVLPGDDGVRHMLVLRPWESTKTVMLWLSSPWATAWFGLANPPLYADVAESFTHNVLGAPLVTSANAMVSITHVPWRTLSMLIGFAGVALFVYRVLRMLISREEISPLQSLAIMLGLFALATAVIIGVGRNDFFMTNPDQVFADRYLMWPCLFWCGLALLLLVDIRKSQSRALACAGTVFLLVAPVVMLLMQNHDAGWSAVVYQNAQRSAAASRSGVIDLDVVNGNADDLAQFQKTEALFRERDLAMFGDPAWHSLGQRWTGSLDVDNDVVATTNWVAHFENGSPTIVAKHFEGIVSNGIGHLRAHGQLALLDDDDRIAGFAEFSNIGRVTRALMFGVPRKRGFDGYVAIEKTPAHYRLAWLDIGKQRGILLGSLPAIE